MVESLRGGRSGGFAEATWSALDRDAGRIPPPFDAGTLTDVPAPAQRLLSAALPAGTPLHDIVRLSMRGEIRLAGRWMRFTAEQILAANAGFVWAPVVGGRLVRFVGADALGPDGARIEFRLHGWIPVVRGAGPDIARSANGRLAAETVAWLPTALTPQAGARWSGHDHHRATVALQGPGGPIDVDVTVDDEGAVTSLGLQRWKDSAKPPALSPFGGTVSSRFATPDGVSIAGAGTIGWDWGTPGEAEGEFFRFEITKAAFGPSPDTERYHEERP
ncbi:MAG: DUF6544 family protein [Acidimicrobiales bacterium]